MSKIEIYNSLVDGYKRTKARAYASLIGIFIWVIFGCDSEFTISDIVITVILITICVIFCDITSKKQLILQEAEKLGYKNGNHKNS